MPMNNFESEARPHGGVYGCGYGFGFGIFVQSRSVAILRKKSAVDRNTNFWSAGYMEFFFF
jgi:hypothetical protein